MFTSQSMMISSGKTFRLSFVKCCQFFRFKLSNSAQNIFSFVKFFNTEIDFIFMNWGAGSKLVLNSRIWVVAGSVWTSEFYRGDTLVLNCSFLSIINQFSKPRYNLDSKPRYLGIVGCRRNWEYLTFRIFGYWESSFVEAISNRFSNA